MRWRVVCALKVTLLSFWPTMALMSVDLPAGLGGSNGLRKPASEACAKAVATGAGAGAVRD
jgi:hypothetical protein